tara:strand:- start:617 stop:1114 length:498 start_codon:yes stop_codon:yes gene_type:complete
MVTCLLFFGKKSLRIEFYLLIILGWLLVSGCTKHEEYSLPPKLGEKGNGVTIQGVVYQAKTSNSVAALVELGHLNIGKWLYIVDKVTEYQCDSSGVFKFTDVVIKEGALTGYTDDVITHMNVSYDEDGLILGVRVKYDGVYYSMQELPIFNQEPKELYELEIWLY